MNRSDVPAMRDDVDSARARRIGIFTTGADLVIQSWDAALEQMTGIPSARACGARLDELVPDLESRGLLELLTEPLASGSPQVLAPALHRFLIPCAPLEPSTEFEQMQQRVVVGSLRDDARAHGLVVTVEDVTTRLERERQLARELRSCDPATRVEAVHQLAPLQSPDTLGPLGSAMGDDDWRVRRAAVRALAAREGAVLVDALIAALREGHKDFSVLSSALQLLTMTGVDVTGALIRLLGDVDPDLRIQAALALGAQRKPEAVSALLAALDDADVNVRFHAIEAIGKLGPIAAVEPLARIAESRDFFLAFPAIEALVQINDPSIAPTLASLLTDPMLAGAAAEALGRVGDEGTVEPLVDALSFPDVPVIAVVNALASIHRRYQPLSGGAELIEDMARQRLHADGVQRVIHAVSRASGDSLRNAIVVCGWLRDPAVPMALARLLGTADVHREMVEALARHGAPVVDLLIEQLDSEDPTARRTAVVALGRIGDRKAVPSLLRVLEQGDALLVPVAAALARLGDTRAFMPLLGLLGHPQAAVRQTVIGALNSIGHPAMASEILARLEDPDPLVRDSAVKVAGYFGYHDCIEPVLALCRDTDEGVRCSALSHLPYFDDSRTFDVLSSALANGTPRARGAAAQALGAVDGAPSRDLLHRALGDTEPWVRYFAATSLAKIGDAASVPELARVVGGDPAEHVRVAAIEAVGLIGGAEAVQILEPLVANDAGESGHAAARVIGRLPGDGVIDTLRAALRSADPLRRAATAEALGVRATEEAAAALEWTASADADAAVTRAALGGLTTIANSSNTQASRRAVGGIVATLTDPERCEWGLAAVSRLSAPAIVFLAELLGADDPHTRRAVVGALGRLAHPAASAVLRSALGDADPVVRRQAVAALTRLGTQGLTPRLLLMAERDPSPAVRHAAMVALQRRDRNARTGEA
jgi:HEAT repeat protein